MIKYTKIGSNLQQKVAVALLEKGHNVSIQWNEAFWHTTHRKVPVTCNVCKMCVTRSIPTLEKGKFQCAGCISNRLTSIAKQNGFTLLEKVSAKDFNICCDTCKHSRLILASGFYQGGCIGCPTCLENKYKEIAEKLGFDFICKLDNKQRPHVRVRCKIDQNEVTLSTSQLVAGSIWCQVCQETNYRAALNEKNCSLLSYEYKQRAGSKKTVLTYENLSGEIFEASSADILNGKFATTKDNHWHAAHSTYLIVNNYKGTVYCKIGTANVPKKRLKDLKLIGQTSVFTLASFPNRFSANALESALHQEFKHLKLSPEIASTFTGAEKKSRRVGNTEYVTVKDGLSEWFMADVYNHLKTRYKLE